MQKTVFSDEKLFLVQQSHKAQNNRVYSVAFEDLPEEVRTVQRFENSNAVMVWGAISEKGKLALIFIDRGVKMNKEYYQREILYSVLKPEVRQLFPEGGWAFQQDSAPERHGKSEPRVVTKLTARVSSAKKNSHLARQILTHWTTAYGGLLESKVNTNSHRSLESL